MSYFQEMIQSASLKAYESENKQNTTGVYHKSQYPHTKELSTLICKSPYIINFSLDKTRQDIYYYYINVQFLGKHC